MFNGRLTRDIWLNSIIYYLPRFASVDGDDVTFEEALDAILKPNGFRWVEEGKFIYVYTQEEFARMEALDRKTESRMFELEHLSARDASEFATPLLSDRGKLSFIGQVEGGIEQQLDAMGAASWAKSAILVVNVHAWTHGRQSSGTPGACSRAARPPSRHRPAASARLSACNSLFSRVPSRHELRSTPPSDL